MEWDPASTLLLACASPLDSQKPIRAHIAKRPDWPAVMRLAATHRLLPFLAARCLKEVGLPPEIRATLEAALATQFARFERLKREQVHLLGVLADAGIAALPLRGGRLSERLYGNTVPRPSDDIDLLLHRAELDRAGRRLEQEGYALLSQRRPAEAAAFLRAGGACTLQHPTSRHQADLLWTDVKPYLNTHMTLPNLLPHTVPGDDGIAQQLATEMLLITLCIHGTKHLWSRHLWTCDVATLVARHPALDWERVLQLAPAFRARRMLLAGLHWAHELFGIEFPECVHTALRADHRPRVFCEVLLQKFNASPDWAPADDGERARLHLRVLDRTMDRARYIALRTFTPSPNDWQSLPLPGLLFPLYHLTRPIRLIYRRMRRKP